MLQSTDLLTSKMTGYINVQLLCKSGYEILRLFTIILEYENSTCCKEPEKNTFQNFKVKTFVVKSLCLFKNGIFHLWNMIKINKIP